MIDIDFLKQYNYNYRHQKGDVCLQSVAQELVRHVTDRNMYVVRYGGEEFLICCAGYSRGEAERMAERLLGAGRDLGLERTDIDSGHITVSIGVAFHDSRGGKPLDEFIREADVALYEAKQSGRDRIAFFRRKIPWEGTGDSYPVK